MEERGAVVERQGEEAANGVVGKVNRGEILEVADDGGKIPDEVHVEKIYVGYDGAAAAIDADP